MILIDSLLLICNIGHWSIIAYYTYNGYNLTATIKIAKYTVLLMQIIISFIDLERLPVLGMDCTRL